MMYSLFRGEVTLRVAIIMNYQSFRIAFSGRILDGVFDDQHRAFNNRYSEVSEIS
jgi:hypothetical protein